MATIRTITCAGCGGEIKTACEEVRLCGDCVKGIEAMKDERGLLPCPGQHETVLGVHICQSDWFYGRCEDCGRESHMGPELANGIQAWNYDVLNGRLEAAR